MSDNPHSAPEGSGGGGGGHFTAPAADKPEFNAFNSLKDDGKPPTLQERLASFKDRAAKAASQAYESTVAATAAAKQRAAERDWSKEQQVLGRVKGVTLGYHTTEYVHVLGPKFLASQPHRNRRAAEKVGSAATAGGNWVWNASSRATNAIKGDAISVLARQEAGTRPVPRTVLVCCASLIATGPATPRIFSEGAGGDLVTFLLNSFEDANGCFLPPPGTSAHVVANVLKQFFATLPEPLLTYKTLPAIVEAGGISADTAALAPALLMDLPATNLNALWLLLETASRIAADAAENEMDARALSSALAPCLAWHAPPPKTLAQGGAYAPAQGFEDDNHLGLDDDDTPKAGGSPGGGSGGGDLAVRRELKEEEAASVARVLEFYISQYGALSRRVYWTPSGQPALLPD